MKRLLTYILLAMTTLMSYAETPENRLFQFERSKNKNYICYDANVTNGALNMKDPIHAYWILAETDGSVDELSFLQKKLAFGYNVVKKGDNEVTITLKAYNGLLIRVHQQDNQWIATTTWNGKEIIISKMYAQLRSPNSLSVEYVDVSGTLATTGETVTERINNK